MLRDRANFTKDERFPLALRALCSANSNSLARTEGRAPARGDTGNPTLTTIPAAGPGRKEEVDTRKGNHS